MVEVALYGRKKHLKHTHTKMKNKKNKKEKKNLIEGEREIRKGENKGSRKEREQEGASKYNNSN